MDKKKLAERIIAHVGGKGNIENVFHCMTRLRFNLKDEGLFESETIEALDGVAGLKIDGREYQIIIGPAVNDVYNEVIEMTGLQRTEAIDELLDEGMTQEDHSVKGVFNRIINVFSSCMNPLVPIFVLLGMANVIAALIGPGFLNLVSAESDIYRNFYWIGQTITYFLPVLIAVTASKTFKTNVYLSLVLACILLYPDLVALMSGDAAYTVYGIPAASVTYSATVIPIMLIVWIQSYVEKAVNRYSPDAIKVITMPLVTILVMLPISLCALGPLGNYIGVALSSFVIWLNQTAGPLETLLVGALCPFITAFGIGRPIFFVCMTTLLTTGAEFAYMPYAMALTNWLSMGVALGYAVKSREAKKRQLGITCFLSNFLGGVSEPTLFGVLLPNKKAYLPVIIGGGIAGLYMGIMNVGMYQFGTSNFLNVLGFMGGSSMNFIHGCIGCGIGIVVTFAMMMVMYKEEKK